jgi:cytoskeleton protein RodZ
VVADKEFPEEGAGNTSPRPSAGEILKAAREARELSVDRLARALNLDLPAVEAIEADRYSVIGAPVFVRGHLRKYADLVGVPPEEVMAAYERAEEPDQRVQLHPMKPEEPVRGDVRLWPIVLVLLLVTGAVIWWLLRPSQPAVLEPPAASEAAVDDAAQEAAEEPPAAERPAGPGMLRLPAPAAGSTDTSGAGDAGDSGTARAPGPAETALPESPGTEAAPATPPVERRPQSGLAPPGPGAAREQGARVPRSETPAAAAPPAGGLAVEFAFSADSWIDVRDARGERLVYELGRSGSTRSVRGEPPLTVFLGYADGVAVRVEGTPWPVPARMRRGNTARFTLEAP